MEQSISTNEVGIVVTYSLVNDGGDRNGYSETFTSNDTQEESSSSSSGILGKPATSEKVCPIILPISNKYALSLSNLIFSFFSLSQVITATGKDTLMRGPRNYGITRALETFFKFANCFISIVGDMIMGNCHRYEESNPRWGNCWVV